MTKYNTGNPVGSSSPLDLYDNAENLDAGINGPATTWRDRRGQLRKSWTGVETDFQQFLADGSTIEFPTWGAAAAAAAAGQIPSNRQVAVIGDQGVHTDPISGSTVPNSGRYVMSAAGLEWRSADVLSEKADKAVVDPLVPVVSRLRGVYQFGALPGYAFNVTCPHPTIKDVELVAGGVRDDGTNHWHSGEYEYLKVANLDASVRALPSLSLGGFALNTLDGEYRAAGGVTDEGVLRYKEANFDTLNGFPVDSLIYAHNANFDGQLNFIGNHGQSLGDGPTDPKTTVQEFDSVGFPAHSTNPTTYLPLTVANCSGGGNREMPVFGLCGMMKQLIRDENGLLPSQQDYQLLVGSGAYSGRTMAQLEKGTSPYAELIGQVQAGFNLAQAEGRRFVASALSWVQGPGDYLSGYRYYLLRQIALANDFDEDCRAITGQTRPVFTLISQSASQGVAHRRTVPLAQLEASLRSPHIVLAAPEYQFKYLPDGMLVHVDGASTRIMGAYLGLALKRTLIDGKKWRPLMPSNIDVQGRVIYVRFNRAGLKIDTTLVPEQPQYGFSLLDPTGAPIALSGIEVVQPDTIRLLAAAAPRPGSMLWLGGMTATGIPNYAGGASNVRDSQGDELLFDSYPLHNWGVVFAAAL
jgi:hypothetical protein